MKKGTFAFPGRACLFLLREPDLNQATSGL